MPTDARLKRYASGQADPDLEATMFYYGRYLLASSSRPGGLPANLQGLWNDSNNPPWASDYHNNINRPDELLGRRVEPTCPNVIAADRLRRRRSGTLSHGHPQGVRRQHPRLDRPHQPEHLRRQRLGMEHSRQRLVRSARF